MVVWPNGIVSSSSQTRSWNELPRSATGTSNAVRSPARPSQSHNTTNCHISRPIRVYAVRLEPSPTRRRRISRPPRRTPANRTAPSIVVLPFTNLGNDPEQQYFADGITEDLTTDLSGSPAWS